MGGGCIKFADPTMLTKSQPITNQNSLSHKSEKVPNNSRNSFQRDNLNNNQTNSINQTNNIPSNKKIQNFYDFEEWEGRLMNN
jgi:hypothetical protein